MEQQEHALISWLKTILPTNSLTVTPLSGDASPRKYYRVQNHETSYVLMDAHAEKESLKPFLAIQNLLKNSGICVPSCFAKDEAKGLLLLTDLGDHLLLDKLTNENADQSYTQLIDTIIKIQKININATYQIPKFDKEHIHFETNLFKTWYLEKHKNLALTPQENQLISDTINFLAAYLVNLPQVFIHRDYHCRNIMCLEDIKPTFNEDKYGIIDFQDAMIGPFTYDLVSLLKDCYIQWPLKMQTAWLKYFYTKSPIAQTLSFAEVKQAFELCGLQRHLKILGIFARLALRDQKLQYLHNLPLTLNYIMICLKDQTRLTDFYAFIL